MREDLVRTSSSSTRKPPYQYPTPQLSAPATPPRETLLQGQKITLAGQVEEHHRRSESLHRLGVSLEIFESDPELDHLFTAINSKLRSLSSVGANPSSKANTPMEFMETGFGAPFPGCR